ncbi:MAG TPA: GYD domain-containing protein [Vicinamibacterales bacterium]|jgi:uncharacterized protein with GYD domain|nr:GYD domain-containing protein [Vicinamibacterales bacterium]
MPKFLLQGSYTAEGAKGVMKDGGTKRRAAAQASIESLGGRLEAFYFAFGDTDVFAIVDFPDAASAAASSLALSASGAVMGKLTVLIAPEEIDAATKKSIKYVPPGH